MNPITLIPIERLTPRPGQVRQTFHNIGELADSIHQYGLLENLIVRERAESGNYEIIAGERRYRALLLLQSQGRLKPQGIPCIVLGTDGVLENIVENVVREDVALWELGRAYAALSEAGLTQTEIALRIGKKQGHVSTAMMLARGLSPGVVQRLALVPPMTFPVQRLLRLTKLVDSEGHPDEALQLRMYKEMLDTPGRGGPRATRARTQKQTVWDRFQRLKHGKSAPSVDPVHRPFLNQVLKYLSGETKGFGA